MSFENIFGGRLKRFINMIEKSVPIAIFSSVINFAVKNIDILEKVVKFRKTISII